MKWIGIFISVLLIMAAFIPQTFAVGPVMVEPHIAKWDANTETDLASYYLYWRPQGGAFDNTKRVLIPKTGQACVGKTSSIPYPCYELLNSVSVNGNYEIALTANDVAGNESGLSNIVPFVLDLPASPKNNSIVQ